MKQDAKLVLIVVYALLFVIGLVGAYKNIRLINGMDESESFNIFGSEFNIVSGKSSIYMTMSIWILLLICSASMTVYTVISYNLDVVSPEIQDLKDVLEEAKKAKKI